MTLKKRKQLEIIAVLRMLEIPDHKRLYWVENILKKLSIFDLRDLYQQLTSLKK